MDPNDRVIMMFVCTCPIVFKFNTQPVVPIPDSEQVWALLARQYFKTNNLDLSATIKCPELSTCTKNLIFPSFYTITFQLWDKLIETEPCK